MSFTLNKSFLQKITERTPYFKTQKMPYSNARLSTSILGFSSYWDNLLQKDRRNIECQGEVRRTENACCTQNKLLIFFNKWLLYQGVFKMVDGFLN